MENNEKQLNKSSYPTFSEPRGDKRVGIIGAGISGLATAKVLSARGFEVTVLEKEPTLGGVWAISRTYPGLRTNNSKETYCFSDHSHSDSIKHFPTAADVRDFLETYSDRFNIRSCIRFGVEVSRVVEAEEASGAGFNIEIREIDSGKAETLFFPHVVICNGAFSKVSMPEIEGRESYSGKVVHSSKCTAKEIEQATSILTIGAGKSALDCASMAALSEKKSTLVFRQAHWMAPRYFPGGARSDMRMVSRFAELFIEYPNRTSFENFLHRHCNFLVKAWWGLQNAVLPKAAQMAPVMIPDRPLPAGFESIGQVDHIYDLHNAGRVNAIRSGIKNFTESGVRLENGETVEADLVVLATGWQRDLSFLDEGLKEKIMPSGRFRLYRRIVPPEIRGLAFIGYFPTLACPISFEIAAHWTAQYFTGDLKLPSIPEMDKEIERLENWARERLPESRDGVFTGPYQAHFINDLMGDMKLRINRTSNFITEYLGTFQPKRYANLAEELKLAAEGRDKAFYLSGRQTLTGLLVLGLLWLVVS